MSKLDKHDNIIKNVISDGRKWIETISQSISSPNVTPAVSKVVNVAPPPYGSDTPIAGQPYATIMGAINAFGDIGTTMVPLVINVAAGFYDETVILPANCYIVGSGYTSTTILAINLNSPSWNTINPSKGGLQDLGIRTTSTFDIYAAVKSLKIQLYLTTIRMFGDILWKTSNAEMQLLLMDCDIEGNFVQQGGAVFWAGCYTAGSIDVNAQLVNNEVILGTNPYRSACYLYDGSQIGADLHVKFNNNYIGDNDFTLTGIISTFSCGNTLNIVGSGKRGFTNITASAIGIPAPELVSVTNKATLTNITFANAIGYNPSKPKHWKCPAPRTVQEALDRIAAKHGRC